MTSDTPVTDGRPPSVFFVSSEFHFADRFPRWKQGDGTASNENHRAKTHFARDLEQLGFRERGIFRDEGTIPGELLRDRLGTHTPGLPALAIPAEARECSRTSARQPNRHCDSRREK
jgi:hypothetical protein